MAKVQSRRSVSLNRTLYDAAAQYAADCEISMTVLVANAIRAYGVSAPIIKANESKRTREPRSAGSPECDCGRPKRTYAQACDECKFLDGEGRLSGLVIEALRGTNDLSLRELCVAVHGRATDGKLRHLRRVVQDMTKSGRLRRYWHEGTAQTRELLAFGKEKTNLADGTGQWVYRLSGSVAKRAA